MTTGLSANTPPGSRAPARNGPAWLVLALACACQFMVILDSSIVNVALPSLDRELGFAASGLAWVVNGYLLTFAGFMLLGGRAADLFGHRRTLTAGLALFSAASLAGGLATVPGVLVAARVAQGVGAALLAPATLAVINTGFAEGRERARAFGAWSAAGGVGGMAGALAGGALTTGLSWRWVFLINVPIGALLLATATRTLPSRPEPLDGGGGRTRPGQPLDARARTPRREPLDLAGAFAGTAGLAALIYGVMHGTDRGWTSPQVAGTIAAGLLLLGAFVAVEARYATRPMMPLRLLRVRGVAAGTALLLIFGGIAIAMWYFTSLFLQNVLGYDALGAGLGQTPAAVTFMVVARFAAGLLPRVGVRALVLAGSACFVTGFGWLSQADPGSAYVTGVLGPTLLIATGIGVTFPTLMAATTAGVPAGDAGTIGGLAQTAHQAGGSIGLAVPTTVAATGPHPEANALAVGYDRVFLVAAALALTFALATPLLPRHRST